MSSNVVYAQFGRGPSPMEAQPSALPSAGAARLLALAAGDEWPIHPTVLVDVVRLVQLAGQPLERAILAIRQEPTLGARALRLANGHARGSEPPCTNVGSAIERLDDRGVRTLLLGVACTRLYAAGTSPELTRRLVVRSAAVAIAAAAIVQQNEQDPTEALLAGCLHDIGWPLGLALSVRHGLGLTDVEVGSVHAELGATAARAWGLSAAVATAIGGHHDGIGSAAPSELAEAVILASRCVDQLAIAEDPAPLDTGALGPAAVRETVWTELYRLGFVQERRRVARDTRGDRRRTQKKIATAC